MTVPIETMENARNFWRPLIDTRFSPANTGGLETVDSELLILEEMRLRALRLRNERTFVCRLPSEILANVFLCLRDGWPPSRRYDPTSPPEQRPTYTSGWMCVTHICRKWRTVAQGTPGLWAKHEDILDTPLQYLPTILARTRTCPLDLAALNLGSSDVEEVMSWLPPPVCLRVRHLYLDTYDQDVAERILSQISTYLLNLRSLNLDLPDYETLVKLPLPICAMPYITDLALQGFRFSWDSAMFSSSLTRLVLQLEEGDQSMQPTYAQFRGLCANMHSLRELVLHDVIPQNPLNDIIRMSQTLQMFEYFAHDGPSAPAALQLLSLIRFPGACTRITSVYHDLDDVALTDDLIGQCLNVCRLLDEEADSRPIEMIYAHGSLLTLKTESAFRTMHQQRRSLHPNALYPCQWKTLGTLAYLRLSYIHFDAHIASLRLNDLRAITLFPDPQLNLLSLLNQLVRCAPSVYRAEIWISDSKAFLHALAVRINGNFPLFPKLEILVLHGAHVADMDESNFLIELTALAACIGVRNGEGSPLREIVVSKNTDSWGVWDALKDDIEVTFL